MQRKLVINKASLASLLIKNIIRLSMTPMSPIANALSTISNGLNTSAVVWLWNCSKVNLPTKLSTLKLLSSAFHSHLSFYKLIQTIPFISIFSIPKVPLIFCSNLNLLSFKAFLLSIVSAASLRRTTPVVLLTRENLLILLLALKNYHSFPPTWLYYSCC